MFTEHYPKVLAYVRRRSPQDANDVVSEVFLTAWRRLDRVPADALPWLLGVARRVLANTRRASGRHPTVALADVATEASPATDPAERLAVAQAFARLSERDREVLMLVAWDGLTGARAARALGCSVAAFHVRLHRARGRLTRALEDAGARPDPSVLSETEGE
jgi:RNA polymerase sigma-70 factor, ECF subfamily